MRPTLVLPVLALGLLVAACAPAASTGGPSPTPAATATAGASAGPVRIEVTLTDALRMEPAEIAVPGGAPVTFVVTNSGVLPHEFFLGDEAAQAEHDVEMAGSGMIHDEPNGIGLDPGETKELTFTFDAAGPTLAGCHVPGHYAAGMKATISVEP